MEKFGTSYTADRNVKLHIFGKQFSDSSKIETKSLYGLAITVMCTHKRIEIRYSNEYMHKHVIISLLTIAKVWGKSTV